MREVRVRRSLVLTLMAAMGAAWSSPARAACPRDCESVKLTSLVVEPPLDCAAVELIGDGDRSGGGCGCFLALDVRNDCSFPITPTCAESRECGGADVSVRAGETAFVTPYGLAQPREGETVFEFSLVEDGNEVEHVVTVTFVTHYPPESSSCAVAASGRRGPGGGVAALALAGLAATAATRRRRRP